MVDDAIQKSYLIYQTNPEQLIDNGYTGLVWLFEKVKRKTMSLDEIIKKLSIKVSDEELYELIDNAFMDELKKSNYDEFIYSPPEIKAVIEELQWKILYLALKRLDKEVENDELEEDYIMKDVDDLVDNKLIKEHVRNIVPLQISASTGIEKQIAQAKFYNGKRGEKFDVYTSVE